MSFVWTQATCLSCGERPVWVQSPPVLLRGGVFIEVGDCPSRIFEGGEKGATSCLLRLAVRSLRKAGETPPVRVRVASIEPVSMTSALNPNGLGIQIEPLEVQLRHDEGEDEAVFFIQVRLSPLELRFKCLQLAPLRERSYSRRREEKQTIQDSSFTQRFQPAFRPRRSGSG